MTLGAVIQRVVLLGALFAAPFAMPVARAAEPATVGVRSTIMSPGTAGTVAQGGTGLSPQDALLAQLWGLSTEEMQRALTLLKGPRGAFSVPNLSPIEALGIHARTPAERRKYAEAFARVHHQDVQRVLAWNQAFTLAMQQLYPGEPVISFQDTPRVLADPALAAAAGVPRSAIEPLPADPLPSPRAQRARGAPPAPQERR
jgi:hypothetical protein